MPYPPVVPPGSRLRVLSKAELPFSILNPYRQPPVTRKAGEPVFTAVTQMRVEGSLGVWSWNPSVDFAAKRRPYLGGFFVNAPELNVPYPAKKEGSECALVEIKSPDKISRYWQNYETAEDCEERAKALFQYRMDYSNLNLLDGPLWHATCCHTDNHPSGGLSYVTVVYALAVLDERAAEGIVFDIINAAALYTRRGPNGKFDDVFPKDRLLYMQDGMHIKKFKVPSIITLQRYKGKMLTGAIIKLPNQTVRAAKEAKTAKKEKDEDEEDDENKIPRGHIKSRYRKRNLPPKFTVKDCDFVKEKADRLAAWAASKAAASEALAKWAAEKASALEKGEEYAVAEPEPFTDPEPLEETLHEALTAWSSLSKNAPNFTNSTKYAPAPASYDSASPDSSKPFDTKEEEKEGEKKKSYEAPDFTVATAPPPPKNDKAPPYNVEYEDRHTSVETRVLSVDITKMILDCCKVARASVQGCITAAAMMAVCEIIKADPIIGGENNTPTDVPVTKAATEDAVKKERRPSVSKIRRGSTEVKVDMSQRLKDPFITCNALVDMRPRANENRRVKQGFDATGNWLSAVQFKRRVPLTVLIGGREENVQFWPLAQELSDDLRHDLDGNWPAAGVQFAESLTATKMIEELTSRSVVEGKFQGVKQTLTVANVGRLHILMDDVLKLKLTDMRFGVPMTMGLSAFAVFVGTIGGRMSITVCCCEQITGRGSCQEMVERIEYTLIKGVQGKWPAPRLSQRQKTLWDRFKLALRNFFGTTKR